MQKRTLYITDETQVVVDKLAQQSQTTKAEILRKAVVVGLEHMTTVSTPTTASETPPEKPDLPSETTPPTPPHSQQMDKTSSAIPTPTVIISEEAPPDENHRSSQTGNILTRIIQSFLA